MNSKTILISGGAGFVGSHIIDMILTRMPNTKIFCLDKLNYSGSLERLRQIGAYPHPDVTVLTADLTLPISDNVKSELMKVTHILHFAAESHVDKSIEDPITFVLSNVLGTATLLNLARELPNLECFYNVNTDESFGPANIDSTYGYKETDQYMPGNPYSGSKASADMMCRAFSNTYNIPVVTTQAMNIVGIRQHPEKFIPLCINKILKGEKITIHGTPDKLRSGVRTYIDATNVADAYYNMITKDIHKTLPYHFYKNYRNVNIVGEKELSNLQVADKIGRLLNKSVLYEIVDFHSSRPGHDTAYRLDGSRLAAWGWTPPTTIEQSLEKIVKWYIENPQWLQKN